MKKLLFLSILLGLAPSAHAVTVALDAGKLTSTALAPMQADNSTANSANGSLLLLLDLGAGGNVSNVLTAGNYVSGNNTVLAAAGFNTAYGTAETDSVFTINGTVNTGDIIALRWFPQLTLAQYQGGAVTTALQSFGTYTPLGLTLAPNGGNPDGGDTWTVPGASATINLNFYTSDSDSGGNESPLAGFAGFTVLPSAGGSPSVPEPSTYALLGLGMLGLYFVARRRQQS